MDALPVLEITRQFLAYVKNAWDLMPSWGRFRGSGLMAGTVQFAQPASGPECRRRDSVR
jgi:hypothetical protein